MKKAVLKGVVFGLIFFIALVVIGRIMNKGNTDMTTDMPEATLPVVYMELNGEVYNELHGYTKSMDVAYMRDTITALAGNRSTGFIIEKYGQTVTDVSYEVRSVDGKRLIENASLTDYEETRNTIQGEFALKDLIEVGEEYSLTLLLSLEEGRVVRYYTRILWSTDAYAQEKLAYVKDFNQKTFDKEAATELTKYLESNSEGDNTNLHKVNIHSSLSQVTWGNLNVKKVMEPVAELNQLTIQTASVVLHYVVSVEEGGDATYYYVEEFYRIRYTPDRTYLLDFERTMTQFFRESEKVYVNDKIILGIVDKGIPFLESADGNNFAFLLQNKLCSYNVTENKLAVLFCFYNKEQMDARTIYNHHDIKILDVDEAGNVQFVVYGYLNRGMHEGEVGVQVYNYSSTLNTIEEALYIPYGKSYEILKQDVEKLLYLTRENYLYLTLDDVLYEVNLTEKVYTSIVQTTQDGSLQVSESHKMIAWQKGEDIYSSQELVFMNLNTRGQMSIRADDGEYVMPLGFMGEDVIYGFARAEDVTQDSVGRTTYPIYLLCIRGADGRILKRYSQEGVYIMGCTIEDNQIRMSRYTKLENGEYQEIIEDQIMNNQELVAGKNKITTVLTEMYEQIVQIAVKKDVDAKTIKILTPKEVLFEGGRELALPMEEKLARYYVYGPEGVDSIYRNPANAVNRAYEISGVVLNDDGKYVWLKGNRKSRSQITAIQGAKVTEEKNSAVICMDSILKYEGISRNTEELLAQGKTICSILSANLPEAKVLDLEGCPLEAVLYYVDLNIPVFVSLSDGTAVLIVGYDEYNLILLDPLRDPAKGTIYKKGMNDSSKWLEENGNCFITYIR